MKLKILFKDNSVQTRLIQNEQGKTIGVEIESPVIEWPSRKKIDGNSNKGENILFVIEAGSTCVCSKCKEEKPPEAFGPSASNRNGLQGWCIKCKRLAAAEKRRKAMENEDE